MITASVGANTGLDPSDGQEPPLRSELFSAEQMEQHGKTLARLHAVSPEHKPDPLLARLADNEAVLLNVRNLVAEAVKESRRITPAGEWLLDNFYLIEEQIRMAKRHLPKGYSRELPRLGNGPSAGLPRVYDIALEIISHGDGRVDPESLSAFLAAYQTVTALKLGELWAIPIMIRLALIENLRRAGSRIASDRVDRNRAHEWAGQMIDTAEKDPKSLILVIADMARSNPPMVSAFVAELARRLQGQSAALALPLTWIEQRLSESGLTIEQLVQSETQQQAVDQVSMSNSIGSLRFLAAMDWREFVEAHSVVEQTLRGDPARVYARMDFATRDRYRHAVETLAKSSPLSEGDVARHAILLADGRVVETGSTHHTAHVGFYLVDKGQPQLEQAVGMRLSAFQRIRRWSGRGAVPVYLGSIALLTAMFTGGFLVLASTEGWDGWGLALIGLLSALASSQLAVTLV
ncbi:MAG: cellobiose phosphorylase, partial [Nitrospira sp.]|nr:cellobiose phosphorylase [Nitrospira sp.]